MFKRKIASDVIMDAVVYIILTILAILMVIPFIYVIAASFATEADILSSPLFLFPPHPTVAAYKQIF